VDEMGRPLYGDVFGVDLQEVGTTADEDEIDKSLWGELESEEEAEEEEEVRWVSCRLIVTCTMYRVHCTHLRIT